MDGLLYLKEQRTGLPRGELWYSGAVLAELGLAPAQESIVTLSYEIGADLCCLSYTNPVQQLAIESPQMELAINKAHALQLLCGVAVDGPFERTVKAQGFAETMKLFYQEDRLAGLLNQHAEAAAAELAAAEKAGADWLILCDDIAYSRGLYFSPAKFQSNLGPLYQKLRHAAKKTVMGFHSDGNVAAILNLLIDQGYSFFSLEPEAMDLVVLSRALPEQITLLSGIKAQWLMQPNYNFAENKQEILDYIASLSTGCNLIIASLCGIANMAGLNNLKQLYGMFS